METPGCAGTYEAGHADCDGGCRWREQCLELQTLCREKGWQPEWLVEKLSFEDLEEIVVGDLEIEIETDDTAKRPKQRIKRIRRVAKRKSAYVFPEETWDVHRHFENMMIDAFGRDRVKRVGRMKPGRVFTFTGTIYPMDKTRTLRFIDWYYVSPRPICNERLIRVYLRTHSPTVRILFPVDVETVKGCLDEEHFSRLDLRACETYQTFLSTTLRADRERVGISVMALKMLADKGLIPIMPYSEWQKRYGWF